MVAAASELVLPALPLILHTANMRNPHTRRAYGRSCALLHLVRPPLYLSHPRGILVRGSREDQRLNRA
jgi:hypothetical protein